MVSSLDSLPRGPGSISGPGYCAVFLGKTLYSHSASLYKGVQMGTSKLTGKPDEMLWGGGGGEEVTCASHLERETILLVA